MHFLHCLLAATILSTSVSAQARDTAPRVSGSNGAYVYTLGVKQQSVMSRMNNRLIKLFMLTDHAEQFLGLPQISQLDYPADPDYAYDTYLVALNWNVPHFKSGSSKAFFKYIRFEGKLAVLNQSSESIEDGALGARILGIYPTMQTVDVNVVNTNTITGTFDPSYQGASIGSVTASNQNIATFDVQVPLVTGLSTNDGWVRWTYYPAKMQRVMLGNKTHFVLVQVPKGINKNCIVFSAHLRYKLNYSLPFTESHYASKCSIDVRSSRPLHEMLTTKAFTVEESLRTVLEKTFTAPLPPLPGHAKND